MPFLLEPHIPSENLCYHKYEYKGSHLKHIQWDFEVKLELRTSEITCLTNKMSKEFF